MERSVDLRQIFSFLQRHILLIILSMIGLALIAFGVAEFVITPQYTATTQLLVNQKKNASGSAAAYQNHQVDVQRINTYKDIITDQAILNQVRDNLINPTRVVKLAQKARYQTEIDGTRRLIRTAQPAKVKSAGAKYNVSIAELENAISVANQPNSQVITLKVVTANPNKSAAVANQVTKVFKAKIKAIMNVNNVTIVSQATANPAKTAPRTLLMTLIGFMEGFPLSVGFALVRELTDTRRKYIFN
ncbi:hypothetical protein BSQ39_05080 [Loigolactobacillus backii]|uniref:YveK family protein n=1 Tax=Loigolactobacillus backii TaxID=375175 RepID=UPI000C1CABEB|nr:Wzz/FepE/Etk N-terminal domain-containing protein [Loigolactobacillus backii]PIO82991.1 hypothetical protein BSQ39_05080 [Loigolactobacillus backii]